MIIILALINYTYFSSDQFSLILSPSLLDSVDIIKFILRFNFRFYLLILRFFSMGCFFFFNPYEPRKAVQSTKMGSGDLNLWPIFSMGCGWCWCSCYCLSTIIRLVFCVVNVMLIFWFCVAKSRTIAKHELYSLWGLGRSSCM